MSDPNQISKMASETTRKHFNLRGFFSLLLFGSFLVLLFSGTILYFTPKGRVAHWTGWAVFGLDKEEWSAIHITMTLVVLIASGFHLYYNWGIFWGYITRKTQKSLNLKKEMALAILLCMMTVMGTIYSFPPFSTIIQWNDDIKDYWEAKSALAPMPHAEDLTIAQLAEVIDMPLEQVTERLKEAGVKVPNPSVDIKDLAATHNTTPSELFAIIRPESRGIVGGDVYGIGRGGGRGLGQGAGQGAGLGGGQGSGLGSGQGSGLGAGQGYGRMTAQQCCESVTIPLEQGLTRLRNAGIEAAGHEQLRIIADRSGKKATDIVQIIHGQ